MKNIENLISKAYDYIVNVLQCQKRFLDNETMYECYYVSIGAKNRIPKEAFIYTYDTIKNMCDTENPGFWD